MKFLEKLMKKEIALIESKVCKPKTLKLIPVEAKKSLKNLSQIPYKI